MASFIVVHVFLVCYLHVFTVQRVKFTCAGRIEHVGINKEWYYLVCVGCGERMWGMYPKFECPEHGSQEEDRYM